MPAPLICSPVEPANVDRLRALDPALEAGGQHRRQPGRDGAGQWVRPRLEQNRQLRCQPQARAVAFAPFRHGEERLRRGNPGLHVSILVHAALDCRTEAGSQ